MPLSGGVPAGAGTPLVLCDPHADRI